MVETEKFKYATTVFGKNIKPTLFILIKLLKIFNKNILEIIEKTSPSYIHQIAIPNFEIKRLINKYYNYSEIENYSYIIIDINNKFWKGENISTLTYEVFFNNENFKIYKKKDLKNCL